MNLACTRTVDHIIVQSDAETIFRLASDIERWPSILPHYRWVKMLGAHDGEQTVEMAARRGWIPVKWTSICRIEPARRQVYYKHIGGATRGMEVLWTLENEGDGVRVTIVHEMTLSIPIVRSVIGRWIVGRFFVHHIAGRTLLRIKELAEKERADKCVVQS
jgi:ribosome-associated toxin RatA of RatAB toxin-antitoxin module